VHLHHTSLDLPRSPQGVPAAALHPQRQHRDWQPLQPGDPLFWSADGAELPLERGSALEAGARWPVFINEAAYGEKGIALSLCRRELWHCQPSWAEALGALV
jgi:aspartoacylase